MSKTFKSLLSFILALTMILSMGIFASGEAACAHKLIKVPAKEGDGINAGNIEYYKCSVCGEVFADKEGKNPIACTAVAVIPIAKGNIGINVNYTLYNNGELVIYGEGPTYDYYCSEDVPSPLAGGKAVGVNSVKYAVYDAIKKIRVKEGITELGNELFRGSSATEVILPSSLKRIGNKTFMDSKISKISFSEGLEMIEREAFRDCKNLTEVKAPESLKIIKKHAFSGTPFYNNLGPGKHKLGSVLLKDNSYTGDVTLETYKIDDGITCVCSFFLPENVQVKNFEASDSLIFLEHESLSSNWIQYYDKEMPLYLGKVLYYYKYKNNTPQNKEAVVKPGTVCVASMAFLQSFFETITIPESVEFIGEACFESMYYLKTVKLPSGLKVIDKKMFRNIGSNAEITIPESVVRIEESAFEKANMKKVVLGENIISIGPYAFKECKMIEKISIPGKIRRIGAEAYRDTAKVYTIRNTDPEDLEHVGADAFKGCKQYEDYMYFDLYFGKVLYKYRERYDRPVPENFVIKEGTVSITENAFEYLDEIKTIELPDSVRYIGNFALNANKNVKINKIPANLTFLGESALNNVHADSLRFPGNLISFVYDDSFNVIYHSFIGIDCNNITCPKNSAADKAMTQLGITHTAEESTALHVPEAVEEKAPTCTEKGMKAHYECAVCGKLFKENDESTAVTAKELEIPMKPHTPVVIPAVPATCTKTGLTEGKKCSVCGKILTDQKVIGKKPHTPGKVQKENIVEASYGKDGSYDEVVYCTVCKTEISRKTVKIPGKPLIMGDADGDSKITASDARLALRFSVGLEKGFTELQLLAADTDKDKKITAADARLILRASVGLEKLK